MLISSKGRYALRIMLELAEHYGEAFIPMKDMAQRQGISKGYIAQIMPILSKTDWWTVSTARAEATA